MRERFVYAAVALALASSVMPANAAYVCRLNPYGDNFLSLRTGPGSGFSEIARLGPNTGLSVLREQGAWLRVQTEDGNIGWVFRRYVCD